MLFYISIDNLFHLTILIALAPAGKLVLIFKSLLSLYNKFLGNSKRSKKISVNITDRNQSSSCFTQQFTMLDRFSTSFRCSFGKFLPQTAVPRKPSPRHLYRSPRVIHYQRNRPLSRIHCLPTLSQMG